MATSAQAVQLVVMATNTTALPGEKVYTIGVQVTTADLSAPGVGNSPVLFIQNIAFQGNGVGTNPGANPGQQSGGSNKPDIQSVQASFIDGSALGNGGPPGPALAASGTNALYKDSWWYNSGTGTLVGVVNSNGDAGVVTTNPAGDGSGVYTLGPTNNVGTLGYLWAPPTGPNPANATAGQTSAYSGLYGPTGGNALDAAPLAGQFVGGVLTVPLAQVVASATIALPFDYSVGLNQGFLSVGQAPYDWLGAPAATAGSLQPIVLDYATNTIHRIPEPGTFVLAGMGALGMVLAWRRRK